jgi:hypothetical protein
MAAAGVDDDVILIPMAAAAGVDDDVILIPMAAGGCEPIGSPCRLVAVNPALQSNRRI